MPTKTHQYQSALASASTATTSYGSPKSSEIDASNASMMGFIFDVDALASLTSFEAKLEVEDSSGLWHPVYRNNAGTLELEEFTIALTALSLDNTWHILMDVEGLGNIRWKWKGTGGGATVQGLQYCIVKRFN